MSRLKILCVSSDTLASLLSLDGTKRIKIEGLPADAHFVGVTQRVDMDLFAFRVESAAFSEVSDAHPIPELCLTCREIQDESDTPLVVEEPTP